MGRRESDCDSSASAGRGCATQTTASFSSLAGVGRLSSLNTPSDPVSSRDDEEPSIEQEHAYVSGDALAEWLNPWNALSNLFFGTCSAPARPCDGSRYIAPNEIKYDFYQLEQLGALGRGSFGSVTLVKCHVTDKILALKGLSKGMIMSKKLQSAVQNEKMVLQRICSPFVVKLLACFNREDHLYFLMEAATGGSLRKFYKNQQVTGCEVHGRFFFACIVQALDHLHGHSIIYRDLKPDNVVLDENGYGKLCDFGLAKFLAPSSSENGGNVYSSRAYTMCGTPEYIAPEVVAGLGYKFGADWWALGVVTYELMTGRTPFRARNIRRTFVKARAGVEEADLPNDADWAEVVRSLCKQSPGERLPMRNGGVQALQATPWFSKSGFDWDAHVDCKMPPPFAPEPGRVRSLSIGNKPANAVLYRDPKTGWDRDFESVIGPCCNKMSAPVVDGIPYL